MSEAYKFQSRLVTSVLPYGTTHSSQVKREEVTPLFLNIYQKTQTDIHPFSTFVYGAIKNSEYGVESMITELKNIEMDIRELKRLLEVQ